MWSCWDFFDSNDNLGFTFPIIAKVAALPEAQESEDPGKDFYVF